jgi:hypothetical protein
MKNPAECTSVLRERIRIKEMRRFPDESANLFEAYDRAVIFVTIFRAAKRDSHIGTIEIYLDDMHHRGSFSPSTKTLLRYAQATGNKFHVRLSAA